VAIDVDGMCVIFEDASSTWCYWLINEFLLRQFYVYLIILRGAIFLYLPDHNFSFDFTVNFLSCDWGCNLIMFTHFRTEERATGWYLLTREILKLPLASPKESSKDKSQKMKRPQLLIKFVMRRFKNSCVFSMHVDVQKLLVYFLCMLMFKNNSYKGSSMLNWIVWFSFSFCWHGTVHCALLMQITWTCFYF